MPYKNIGASPMPYPEEAFFYNGGRRMTSQELVCILKEKCPAVDWRFSPYPLYDVIIGRLMIGGNVNKMMTAQYARAPNGPESPDELIRGLVEEIVRRIVEWRP